MLVGDSAAKSGGGHLVARFLIASDNGYEVNLYFFLTVNLGSETHLYAS